MHFFLLGALDMNVTPMASFDYTLDVFFLKDNY